ncbi:hypothetical protein [Amycolatopsis anabasis]|uniref:hypothetical protein n=1 Tax=Amycolatopsis anabasis TaxID=1840409 RepID=UPI00131E22E6|nr:hypothetical protein [Amycolatopsis anabasis]
MLRKEKPRTRLNGPLLILAAAMAGLCLVAAGGLIFDDRTLANQPIWLKTFKFTISIAIYAVTLAWLLSLLPKGRRAGWWMGAVVAAGMGLDMVLMVVQMIGRGRRLHFNLADESDRMIHNLLATGAYATLLAMIVVAGILCFQRLPNGPQASAVRAGLGLTITGLLVAIFMFNPTPEQQRLKQATGHSDILGAHSVGATDGGPGLPLLGWSTEGGDLRVPHFIGLHALQLLPLLLIALTALSRRFPSLRSPFVRRGLIRIAGAGYLGLLLVLTWQALRGESVVHPGGETLLALAAVAVLTLAGGAAVVRHGRALTKQRSSDASLSGWSSGSRV